LKEFEPTKYITRYLTDIFQNTKNQNLKCSNFNNGKGYIDKCGPSNNLIKEEFMHLNGNYIGRE
jgi:hypothetical protein